MDNMQNGSETGVDCGGSCGACPNYKINGPNTGDTVGSGCNGGPAFMCTRDMVFSPEFKVAETDDFASPTNPQFVYGVVGHDKDTGGLDTESGSNACCQCYQLVFTSPRDNVSGVATPKPMIVQAFNTGAGGGKNFDIFMGSGGEGANTAGCSKQYTAYPTHRPTEQRRHPRARTSASARAAWARSAHRPSPPCPASRRSPLTAR